MGFFTPFLRLFFRLLYREFAWSYDFVSAFVSGGRWNQWTGSASAFVKGPKILELGFGPGHLLVSLAKNGYFAVGLDPSRQMVRRARAGLASQNKPAYLARGKGQSLPFKAEIFNSIVATFPTAYIFQADTLAEINRVLAAGGCLVILLSAWITEKNLVSRSLAWLFRVTGQVPPDNFNQQAMLQPFKDAGFNPQTRWLDLKTSRLLFIIAEKK